MSYESKLKPSAKPNPVDETFCSCGRSCTGTCSHTCLGGCSDFCGLACSSGNGNTRIVPEAK